MTILNIPMLPDTTSRFRNVNKDAFVVNGIATADYDGTVKVEKRPGVTTLVVTPAGNRIGDLVIRGIVFDVSTSRNFFIADITPGFYSLYRTNGPSVGTTVSFIVNFAASAVELAHHVDLAIVDYKAVGDFKIIIRTRQNVYVYDELLGTLTVVASMAGRLTQRGIATLDNMAFVLGIDGKIWNCEPGNFTNWPALNNIRSTNTTDAKMFIASYKTSVVVWGQQSLEFYANEGGQVGSPLSVRRDINYKIGVAGDEETTRNSFVWADGTSDSFYWVATESPGKYFVARLSNYTIDRVSTPLIDMILSQSQGAQTLSQFSNATGAVFDGRRYFIVTVATYPDDAGNPTVPVTLVYDEVSQVWVRWTTPQGVMSTYIINQTFTSEGTTTVPGAGAVDAGACGSLMISATGQSTFFNFSGIDKQYNTSTGVLTQLLFLFRIQTQKFRGDTATKNLPKFIRRLSVIGDRMPNLSSDVGLSWSDDDYTSFTASRVVNMSLLSGPDRMTRLGMFQERAFRLDYTGDSDIRIETIELDISIGQE